MAVRSVPRFRGSEVPKSDLSWCQGREGVQSKSNCEKETKEKFHSGIEA
jgi:hypothetical protein